MSTTVLRESGLSPAKAGRISLTQEVLARLDQELRSRPVEDLPSDAARPIYDLLVNHGFDRADLLAFAASMVDLVASDVKTERGGHS